MNELIERMAQECQLIGMRPHLDGIYAESLEAFAKAVARECADMLHMSISHEDMAQAIRERFGIT
jgi:hypothetical protein